MVPILRPHGKEKSQIPYSLILLIFLFVRFRIYDYLIIYAVYLLENSLPIFLLCRIRLHLPPLLALLSASTAGVKVFHLLATK